MGHRIDEFLASKVVLEDKKSEIHKVLAFNSLIFSCFDTSADYFFLFKEQFVADVKISSSPAHASLKREFW